MTTTPTPSSAQSGELKLSITPTQIQALYLLLLRRQRPEFGWMEEPLVAIEATLKPAHDAIHDRSFNAMNRQFFGDDRFKFDESPMPTALDARAAASAHTIGEDAADGAMGELPPLPAPLEIDWPELHSQALGCGVEDRDVRDRYEAAEYGWQDGVDRAAERVPEEIFTADQMREYAHAAIAALTAEKVAGQEVEEEPDCWAILTPNGSRLVSPDEAKGRRDAYPLYRRATQQPAQPVAQTLALTDEQRGAISRAADWCYAMAYEADEKALRALLAAQPESSLAEGGERE